MWLAATRVSTAPCEHRLAIHRLPGRHHRQAAGGRDAERVHRLADDVFPQHRPERGAAVAAARETRLARALSAGCHAFAGRRDLFAEQDRAAVAERREVAELMTGIRLRDRPRAVGQGVAGEDRRASGPSSASASSPSASPAAG